MKLESFVAFGRIDDVKWKKTEKKKENKDSNRLKRKKQQLLYVGSEHVSHQAVGVEATMEQMWRKKSGVTLNQRWNERMIDDEGIGFVLHASTVLSGPASRLAHTGLTPSLSSYVYQSKAAVKRFAA